LVEEWYIVSGTGVREGGTEREEEREERGKITHPATYRRDHHE
jgi:hypothetical protein